MQKLLVYILLALPLSGCIGRMVSYEPGFSQQSISPDKPATPLIMKRPGPVEPVYKGYTNFILSRNPRLDKNIAGKISEYVTKYCEQFGLDTRLVLALIAIESGFRPEVISSSGAMGLGQLLKGTARDMGVENPFDPEENVRGTTKFLARLYKKWDGNTERVLASYKTGEGTVSRLIKSNKDFPVTTKKYISNIKLLQEKITN